MEPKKIKNAKKMRLHNTKVLCKGKSLYFSYEAITNKIPIMKISKKKHKVSNFQVMENLFLRLLASRQTFF